MSLTIQVVMLETYPTLRSSHMWHNANRHLGHLFKSESQFNQDFLAFISGMMMKIHFSLPRMKCWKNTMFIKINS